MEVSTSQNACMIDLVGGPFDGESHLHDHPYYDTIQISMINDKQTVIYKPTKVTGRFVFDRIVDW